MKAMSMGDYYVWFCDWCDSKNLIPWTRTSSGKVCCGGCQKEYSVAASSDRSARLAAASM